MFDIARLIVQITIIVAAARLVGFIFLKLRQPQVVGEMVAGILLGPSLLGWVAPHISAALFPTSSLNPLEALSQLGLVLYMFLVGLRINPSELKKQGHAAVLTSHVGITLPFAMATWLAIWLYPLLCDNSVGFTSFAMFMGAAMSVTAFPVLARILSDWGMLHTRLGTVAISSAAVDDVTGWCVLAYIVILVRAAKATTPIWVTVAGLLAFIVVMVFGIRRPLARLAIIYERDHELTDGLLAMIVLFVLASAYFMERFGVHVLFGAFLAGAVMPRNEGFVRYIYSKLQFVPAVILLPLFFALTGLRTNIDVIRSLGLWVYCFVIIGVAIAGKLGGCMVAARITGMPARDAVGLGILMNTRGLMELVILNVGRDIGVISPALFSMMVFMALVTTFMTTPLLQCIYPTSRFVSDRVPIRRSEQESRLRATAV
jgi:Kef-type K+ transport system membrane component KefB